MGHWSQDAIFYHLYPLGLCAAPQVNDFASAPVPRLDRMLPWLDQARDLGADALYLGPVMESGSHGYDTADYFQVDRRLGDNETLAWLAGEARQRGLRVVLEGVFHHVGRHFWAFRDVLAQGRASRFADWFHLDFDQASPLGDPFTYQTWNGFNELVKLNLGHPEVRSHLLEATATWLRQYHIDGLRLDAADKVEMAFLAELSAYCHDLKPDFWLLGEVLHGDYRRWTREGGLDAVTNYECYKGLYSSLLESNFFEIAHSLRRQFGGYGLYRGMGMYSFVDNHDVDRLASRLGRAALLYPAYALLMTMPGIPALYYGSEFGIAGVKSAEDDWRLRPALDLDLLRRAAPQPDLAPAIARLTRLRAACPALRQGDYQELALGHKHLVFARHAPEQTLVVGISAEDKPLRVDIDLPGPGRGRLVDRLNPGRDFEVSQGRARGLDLPPCWAVVMEFQPAA